MTSTRRRILLVEDRDSLRRMLERALSGEGYQVTAVADGEAGIARLGDEGFDLVLTDLKLPGASGLEVLAAARERGRELPVILLTGYGTVPIAVEAMRGGAYSFLEKPVEIDDLSRLVAEALGEPPAGPGGEAGAAGGPPGLHLPGGPSIIGRHPKLRAALNLLRRVAATEATVLLTGESGTGKELFARAIHGLSPRRAGPFAAVNCAAIPETLVENELFGHEKGAFTGADRRQAGRFEAAAGGTLFLDEIGELPLAVQGKVLRVIDERTFERIGAGSTLQADVRLVAATNRELGAMVASGGFRADLYYRLEVFPIELPPLRERPSDVPPRRRRARSSSLPTGPGPSSRGTRRGGRSAGPSRCRRRRGNPPRSWWWRPDGAPRGRARRRRRRGARRRRRRPGRSARPPPPSVARDWPAFR
jgi:DNA-binding NtrC family response regulator